MRVTFEERKNKKERFGEDKVHEGGRGLLDFIPPIGKVKSNYRLFDTVEKSSCGKFNTQCKRSWYVSTRGHGCGKLIAV